MKKTILLLMAAMLLTLSALPAAALAADKPVSALSAAYANGQLTFSGSVRADVAATAVLLCAPDGSVIQMNTCEVGDDGAFSGAMSVRLTTAGTYTVKATDYDGGAFTETTFSLYAITYYLNGGTNNAGNPRVYSSAESVTLLPPSRAGFDFAGWYADSAFATKLMGWNAGATGGKSLYAKWAGRTAVGLSCTKTDVTLYGGMDGSVTISAFGASGSKYDYSINGGASWQSANVFAGLAAGNYTAAARDADDVNNFAICAVTIGQPAYKGAVAAKKLPRKPAAGTALTITPPVAPKGYAIVSITYSSSNPSVATVDGNGNVTFLAGGKATIITKVVSQMTDKKGKIKTKTTTVKKSVTVQQPVASISLSAVDATIARKGKVKLTAGIAPGTASNKKLKWTSSNKKVVTVSSSGVVTGKAGGTAVITCTAKDGSGAAASCTVTVTPIYPAGIKLNKASLTVKLGKKASLKATVAPKNTDFKTVTWASSNPAAATVDAKGRVRGIAPGTAVITVTTANGLRASCTVTVQ